LRAGAKPFLSASDHAISREIARTDLRDDRDDVRAKADVQTVLLPIDQGVELTVKWTAVNQKLEDTGY
jgi:hypothetical protein